MSGLLCTPDEVIAMLKLTDRPPGPDEIEQVCRAATDAIQTFTKRQFTPDAEESSRTFRGSAMVADAGGGWLILTGDMNEVVSVDDGEPVEEFRLYPLDPAAPGYPSTGIVLEELRGNPITVTGKWGWPAVPEDVHYAAVQQAAAWYTLDSSRLSDSWSTELGAAAAPIPARSLLYGVKDTVRPYRLVSMG